MKKSYDLRTFAKMRRLKTLFATVLIMALFTAIASAHSDPTFSLLQMTGTFIIYSLLEDKTK